MPNNPFGGRESRPYGMGAGDNGAGSSADPEGRYARGYRSSHSPPYNEYGTDLRRLHDMISNLEFKNKALETDLQQRDRAYSDLSKRDKDLNNHCQELNARHEGTLARCLFLEDELQRVEKDLRKAKDSREKHKHAEEELEDANKKLVKENEKLRKKLNRISMQQVPQQPAENPLAQRFERKSSKAPASMASGGPPYIEPFGPYAPRMGRRNSISGPRAHANVNVAHREEPQYSTIPRTYQEPGEYVPYPISNTRL